MTLLRAESFDYPYFYFISLTYIVRVNVSIEFYRDIRFYILRLDVLALSRNRSISRILLERRKAGNRFSSDRFKFNRFLVYYISSRASQSN